VDFMGEPMSDKPVTDLPGIGAVLGNRLEKLGFKKAWDVLGQFLVLKKDKELFKGWLNVTCGANDKQSSDCYECLSYLCYVFL
jgi:nucleotidyltransferase/DNA polymerase involved in DNA repair